MPTLTASHWSAWRQTWRQLRQYSQIGPAAAQAVQEELPEVPVEVAAFVRRRNLGTVEVPLALSGAVEAAAAASSSRSSKLQRKETLQLTAALKQLSRTPGKGGSAMSLIDANAGSSEKRRRKRTPPVKQTLRDLRHALPVSMTSPEEDDTDDSDAESSWDKSDATEDQFISAFGNHDLPEREPVAASSPEYDSARVAAYASSRMPACYAVLFRVFDELHLQLPHFAPRTMLDFGSGPGTAIWAAREVWEQYPQRVTAIEPSDAMVKLAADLQHAQRAQQPSNSSTYTIQWHRQLHPSMLPTKKSKAQQISRQTYDLVVASYVLTEMSSDAARQQAVDMLWRQTKDVLVLIEPGTPSGSAHVRHARTQVLSGGSSSSALKQSQKCTHPEAPSKQSQPAGAHVVAPCPHDGNCPMEGTKSWCHFAQRFQRSDLQRRHKVLPGGHGARTYQDERFSYVVLRRGARPTPHTVPELTIARQRQIDPPDAVQQAIDAGAIPRSPTHMSAMQQQNGDSSSLSWDDHEEEEEDSHSAAWAAMNLPEMDDATRQLILKSIKANAASDEEEDEEELLQMLSQPMASEGATDLPREAGSASATMFTASTAVADTRAVTQTNMPHALQTDDNSILPQELRMLSTELGDINDIEDAPAVSRNVKLLPRRVDADSLEGYDQWDQNYWRDKEPEAVDATLAAAQVWSRIIRTPRKRGKHIILDVCSPQMHGSEAVDTSHGHLVRQVVATTDKKTWLGPGGYRLARKSRWGDLWPKFYQDYALTHKLS